MKNNIISLNKLEKKILARVHNLTNKNKISKYN